ncbi:MAG: hypothetical protein VX288_06955 [Planctomycetota bacterium]|nr:hypothetical protein [Planctomycetota bacterium]
MKRLPVYLGLLLVTALSALLCNQFKGADGLVASGAGIALGIVLVAGSHFLAKLSASQDGTKMLAAFYGSLLWSFGMVIVAVVVVNALYPELTGSVVLPALGFYLVYRFDNAIRSWVITTGTGSVPGVSTGEVK